MKRIIDDEFLEICIAIRNKNISEIQWTEIESSDMFQSDSYCGGFDSLEMAFCFSFYDSDGKEYWFQITFEEVNLICEGNIENIDIRTRE